MKETKYAGTQTEKNLMAAFAGESEARNIEKSSGYSQSASLLAHNRIAASQLIRSGLYHS